jgi:hypothetical protein
MAAGLSRKVGQLANSPDATRRPTCPAGINDRHEDCDSIRLDSPEGDAYLIVLKAMEFAENRAVPESR